MSTLWAPSLNGHICAPQNLTETGLQVTMDLETPRLVGAP